MELLNLRWYEECKFDVPVLGHLVPLMSCRWICCQNKYTLCVTIQLLFEAYLAENRPVFTITVDVQPDLFDFADLRIQHALGNAVRIEAAHDKKTVRRRIEGAPYGRVFSQRLGQHLDRCIVETVRRMFGVAATEEISTRRFKIDVFIQLKY